MLNKTNNNNNNYKLYLICAVRSFFQLRLAQSQIESTYSPPSFIYGWTNSFSGDVHLLMYIFIYILIHILCLYPDGTGIPLFSFLFCICFPCIFLRWFFPPHSIVPSFQAAIYMCKRAVRGRWHEDSVDSPLRCEGWQQQQQQQIESYGE